MITEELIQQQPFLGELRQRLGDAIEDALVAFGELRVQVQPASIVPVLDALKKQHGFVRLSAVTAVDWHPREPRFDVVYHLHSLDRNQRLRIKCLLGGEAPEIDSATGVWRGANWYEREVFDLFGIRFRNHPDLRRIMMPDEWQGHPLRKDFPVHGHKYTYQEQ